MDLHNRPVTIMGLGHFGGGVAAARWLARQGALVTVTDLADPQSLAPSLDALDDVPIAASHLGGHREDDFRDAELVVVNPAVRPGNPLLEIAQQAGVRIATEIELAIEACPAPIIGVTGSNGKSTTAAMTAAILRAAGRRTWLAGNIGRSLLEDLDQVRPDDWVVLEISSFQLWHMAAGARIPHISVVTGCSPNHLDWHRGFAEYVAAKQRMLIGQTAEDLAVLNSLDPEATSWSRLVPGRLLPLPPLESLPLLAVPGRHNQINAACAAAAASGAGCRDEAIARGLKGFRGLPQRLEWLAVIDGRRIYNDSTATTPESTIAALQSLDGPVWLLAGGRDKGFDFNPMVAEIVHSARGAAFFGSVGPALRDRTLALAPGFRATAVETMEEALARCWRQSVPGDRIVLSPGCSSHDQFRNFRERGQRFTELVGQLAGRTAS